MLIGAFSQYLFGIAIFVSSMFLILLVLVQRGRGGGLTGALGGPGGQSAFGTKAGDLFTRITVGVAAVWIVLCASSVYFLKTRGLPELTGGSRADSSNTMGSGGDQGDAGTLGSSGTTGLDLPDPQLPSSDGEGSEAAQAGAENSPEGPADDTTANSDVQAEVTSLPDTTAGENASEKDVPTEDDSTENN